MRLPMKSPRHQQLMIGITSAAPRRVLRRGDIHALLAAPVAVGVLAGAAIGTRSWRGCATASAQGLLPVLVYLAVSMLLRRPRGGLP